MKIKEILKGVIYGNDYIMPLWKELLFGCLIILGLSSFCGAGSYTYSGTFNSCHVFSIPVPYDDINLGGNFSFSCDFASHGGLVIWHYVNLYGPENVVQFGTRRVDRDGTLNLSYNSNIPYPVGLTFGTLEYCNYQSLDYSCIFTGDNIKNGDISCPDCPTCIPQYTSEECQNVYGLVSSGVLTTCNNDLQSCQNSLSGYDTLLNNCSTNLNSCNSSLSSCLQLNCPVSSGGVSWSSLFINDIQHIGAPTINISIPNEIQWDYLNENDEFNLTVDGYNTDSDYIEGIINIQNSKPSKEDLNNIITKVIPLFVPGLVIILFIYFVFKLIKKIF